MIGSPHRIEKIRPSFEPTPPDMFSEMDGLTIPSLSIGSRKSLRTRCMGGDILWGTSWRGWSWLFGRRTGGTRAGIDDTRRMGKCRIMAR